jgi:hypothetical protein
MQIPDSNRFEISGNVATCPECSSTLILEVVEWEADTGRPTSGGCLVSCEADEANETDIEHQYLQSDWAYPQWKVEEYSYSNIRVQSELTAA